MTNSNWQGQVLRRYLPNYTTEEMAVDISKEFISWHDENIKEDMFEEALYYVGESIFIKNKKNKEELIHHILAVCFLASNRDENDARKEIKKELEDLNYILDRQRQPIAELRNLLEQCIKNPMKETLTHALSYNYTDRVVSPFTPEHFKEVLDHYIYCINKEIGGNLKESNDRISTVLRRNIGVLLYPKTLPRKEPRKDSRQNGLCYNLAFLFRHFTQDKEGDWLPSINGPMPKEGHSCYDLIAYFVNIIFCPEGEKVKGEYEKIGELTGDQVRQRIAPLAELGASLDYWL